MESIKDLVFLDNFKWYYKDLFIWKVKYYSNGKRIVYFGEKKNEPKFTVVLKKIKVENNYKRILKEIYFLACCQKSKYFIKLVDIFLSENKNYVFLILKDEGVNLSELIDYVDNNEDIFDYTKVQDMIKWIIFQIVCGLYILHKTKLVHYDIKPGNILVSSKGIVKIADFGSVDKNNTASYGTLVYESPQLLCKQKGSDKDDMWAVGVIMIELYRKKIPYFNWNNYLNQNNDKKILQLKSILSKYELSVDKAKIDVNNNIDFNHIINQKIIGKNYDSFEEELKSIAEIKDPEAFELIKNLLRINPAKRFSAEQALKSKYLSKFKNNFEDCEITYLKKDYEDLLMKTNNKDIFIQNFETIKQKYIGEVLFN